METTHRELLYRDNRPSWSRFMKIWRYYYPVLRPQIIGYPLAVVILCGVCALSCVVFGESNMTWVLTPAVSVMLYLSPLPLSSRDNRFIGSLLPVTAGEKLTFLFVYYYIVVFLLLEGTTTVCIALLGLIPNPAIADFCASIFCASANIPHKALVLTNSLGLMIFGVSGLVFAGKSQSKSVITWIICGYLGFLVLFALAGGVLGVMRGMAGETLDAAVLTEVTIALLRISTAMIVVINIILWIRIYKKLRNSGF